MKKQCLYLLICAAAAVPVSTPTHAAVVSVNTLVQEALENNPELRFYEAEIAAAKAIRRDAGRLPNPELGGSVGRKRLSSENASAEGVAWSVSLVQPFEWLGRLGLRKAIANRDVELAELGLARFRAGLAARVRSLAYSVFAARQKTEAIQQVADRFQALREVLVQRDPAGITPLLETRVIEATELTLQNRANRAAAELQAALVELNQFRGRPPTGPIEVEEGKVLFGEASKLDALLSIAATNNFELRMRAVELAQQGFRVALAKNERYPALSVGPTWSEENAGDRERIIGLSVSAPLPLWNRNSSIIDAAAARQVQAETSLLVARRDVERKVAVAAAQYQRMLSQMSASRPDAAQYFRDAAELADRHYRLGAVPISTYIELQQQYLEATDALLDARKQAMDAANDLELFVGLPKPLVSIETEQKAP